ncbi:hypothetical protein CWI84_06665 [Idiomarina tyrosinivorans]|uniref:Ancillary SecYEG translocon subunit n=1 Tax=Idiomarina tyrosinivorans TaxID=1445662 RepID=A0A432ZQY1_9GAMM|nr:tetratricopeptide repeat protein [Idiomarina tyrosinivorans]RUO80307.1 hypothetical protein CWI84_06665 [Idiomarina tyrosinivorans]
MDNTEEQQVERLKEFWQEHGKGIIAGAVIGFGIFYGWRYYDHYQTAQKEQASAAYQTLLDSVAEAEKDSDALASIEAFVKSTPSDAYRSLAQLNLAKAAVEAGDLDKAKEALQDVATNSSHSALVAIAQLRLARIQVAEKQYDQALATLSKSYPESYNGFVAELQGDVYAAQGNIEKAREAYTKAAASGEQLTPVLEMKINQLAML